MNRRLFGAFGALAVAALFVGGCKSDPLSDLDGKPADVVTDFSSLQMPVGTTTTVTASVLDARTTPLEVPITFSACSSVITVAVDTSYHPIPPTSARVVVHAVTPANSCVVVSGGGLQDTVAVSTVPTAFDGTFSTATPIVGDTLRLIAGPLLSFDVATADIDFGGGIHGAILVRKADTLMVRVPQPDAAQPAVVRVEGLKVNYNPSIIVTLPVTTPFDVHPIGDRETPGTVIITPPASGGPDLVFYDGFKKGANGTTFVIDYLYQFTLAQTDTLTFTLSWGTGADLDMVNLRSNFSVIGGFGAATGANPETYSVIFPAGTYHLLIESFDDHGDPAHLFQVKIHNP